jgi:hypothetical protein
MIVKGNVKAKDGTILPQSTIIVTSGDKNYPKEVDGKTIGTKTDFDGNFTLEIPDSVYTDGITDKLSVRPSDATYKSRSKLLMKNQSTYNFKLDYSKDKQEYEEVEILSRKTNRTLCENAGGVWVDSKGNKTTRNMSGKCWSKNRYDCVQSGGKWDGKKKKCRKGLSTLQMILIGLGVISVVGLGLYLKNKNK